MNNTLTVQEVIAQLNELLAYTTMPTALTDVSEITRDPMTGRIHLDPLVDGMSAGEWAARCATLEDDVRRLELRIEELEGEQ